MHPKYLLENWQSVLFGLLLIGLGVASFMYPDAMIDAEARGRRGLIKLIIIKAWGWPLGVGGLLFGGLCLWGSFSPSDDDD
ncbi:hypothetical protein Pan241w_45680 [Gimesia alba]|uniref:Uncharacterized protein n=1 Tax=Gimesia alba TaxID=2527973 RepID=A0A517RKT1_9PLAN|nr:hypothetical protein [Gimesia alba]QDT44459.1 hypothetical protein Pan241w_45680 [Gimesia alba]